MGSCLGPQNPTVVRQVHSGGGPFNLFAPLSHDFGRKNFTREKGRRLTRFLKPDALRRIPVGSFCYTKRQLPALGPPLTIWNWLQERTKKRASIFHCGKSASHLWIAMAHFFRRHKFPYEIWMPKLALFVCAWYIRFHWHARLAIGINFTLMKSGGLTLIAIKK